MRKASITAYDDFVQGTSATYYSDTTYNVALAMYDKVAVQVVADSASGTTPTLTVAWEHSNDGRNWHEKATLVDAGAVSTTATATFFGSDNGSTPSMALCRVAITLGGTTPACHVRVHVCARDDA
jgi:hypothetical protein